MAMAIAPLYDVTVIGPQGDEGDGGYFKERLATNNPNLFEVLCLNPAEGRFTRHGGLFHYHTRIERHVDGPDTVAPTRRGYVPTKNVVGSPSRRCSDTGKSTLRT